MRTIDRPKAAEGVCTSNATKAIYATDWHARCQQSDLPAGLIAIMNDRFKPHFAGHKNAIFSRYIIISLPEAARSGDEFSTPSYRQLRKESQSAASQAIDLVQRDTVPRLRAIGIGYPNSRFDCDFISLEESSPRNAVMEVPPDKRQALRISAHGNHFEDDTSSTELQTYGISHLIGIEILLATDRRKNVRSVINGLLEKFECPVTHLRTLIHDILIDLGMIHAIGHPWSDLRSTFTSQQIANRKVKFLNSLTPGQTLRYATIDRGLTYLPLAAVCWDGSTFDAKKYAATWMAFSESFERGRVVNLPLQVSSRRQLLQNILSAHPNGKQISPSGLLRKLEQAPPGRHVLYFCLHKPPRRAEQRALNTFMHVSPRVFRTQRWVLLPSASLLAGKYFLDRGFLTWVEFEVPK